MIRLHFSNPGGVSIIIPGHTLHLMVEETCETEPGVLDVTVKDVTPRPEAELQYFCEICGVGEEAEPDGSIPEGWTDRKFENGSHLVCDNCKDVQMCRICGCTEEHGCEEGCHWVADDLCSACIPEEAL